MAKGRNYSPALLLYNNIEDKEIIMNNIKTIDLLRKRNAQMQEELDRLKEINNKNCLSSDSKKMSHLIKELEGIKKEWMKILDELNQEREQYKNLNEDLRNIRESFGNLI